MLAGAGIEELCHSTSDSSEADDGNLAKLPGIESRVIEPASGTGHGQATPGRAAESDVGRGI